MLLTRVSGEVHQLVNGSEVFHRSKSDKVLLVRVCGAVILLGAGANELIVKVVCKMKCSKSTA